MRFSSPLQSPILLFEIIHVRWMRFYFSRIEQHEYIISRKNTYTADNFFFLCCFPLSHFFYCLQTQLHNICVNWYAILYTTFYICCCLSSPPTFFYILFSPSSISTNLLCFYWIVLLLLLLLLFFFSLNSPDKDENNRQWAKQKGIIL